MDRISTLQEFLRKTPSDSFLQHALALEYIKLGEDIKAKELFETILTREPGYVGSYYHLAKLLERNGDIANAIRVYEQGMAMALERGDQHALRELRAAHDDLTS